MCYLHNHVMHLHPMTYNYSVCYLQNKAYHDNTKKGVSMVPNKFKPVIEKYPSSNIVLPTQSNNCTHSYKIYQKTIPRNEQKKLSP